MTWSLRIFNGDLIKGENNSLGTVWGAEKVIQDILCWIRHPIGTDPLNPKLGSFISYGTEGETYLLNNDTITLPDNYSRMVISEIERIIRDYQSMQGIKIEQELSQFGRIVSFSEDEVIQGFNVKYTENADTLYVTIYLVTASDSSFNIKIPIQGQAITRSI